MIEGLGTRLISRNSSHAVSFPDSMSHPYLSSLADVTTVPGKYLQ